MNWQPIETAPKDGKKVILFDGVSILSPCTFDDGRWQMWGSTSWNVIRLDVTHWMPLPEPPNQ